MPSSSGTSSAGPNATTAFGCHGASAARASSSSGDAKIASSRGGEKWRSSAQSVQPNADGARLQPVHDQAEDADGAPLELVVAVDPREPEQHVREHRVARRRRVVVEVLLARDELLAVRRREEEAAALVVAEELDREEREPARLLEPARLAGRDVQLVEPVRDVGVVVEEAGVLGDAVAVRAVEAALGRRERAEQELAEASRRVEPVVALEARAGLGERGEREAVPGGDRLVVAQRLRPLLAPLEQLGASARGGSSPRRMKRPCSNGSRSSSGTPSSGVQVNVSPSTPSVSASCAEANPPSGSASSRSMYVDRLLDDLAVALRCR